MIDFYQRRQKHRVEIDQQVVEFIRAESTDEQGGPQRYLGDMATTHNARHLDTIKTRNEARRATRNDARRNDDT